MTTAILEKITRDHQQLQQERQAKWRKLVADVAADKQPKPDAVDSTLAGVGKSLDDLAAAVDVHRRRLAWKEQCDAQPARDARRAELQKTIADADAILAAADDIHSQTTAPLEAELETIRQQEREARQAQQELHRTCPDAALVAEARRLLERRGELGRRVTELTAAIADNRGLAKSDRQKSKFADRAEAARLLESAQTRDERAVRLERELREVRSKMTELEKQETALRAKMLQP